MKKHQGFKFRLEPDGAQQKQLAQHMGCARFVYNKALAYQRDNFAAGVKYTPYEALCPQLVAWKRDPATLWLANPAASMLQQCLRDLDDAFKHFFKKTAEYPQMKRKGGESGMRYPQNFTVDEGLSRIFVPKVGWVRYRKSRSIVGKQKNLIVTRRAGHWYASIQTEIELPQPIPQATSAVGVDMGIARFLTLSDGSSIAPLNAFRKSQIRLAKAQRAVAKRKMFSKNWAKANAKAQKIHSGIANARRDFFHKASTAISKNHAMVVVENLKIVNMAKSAKGTKAAPGKGVKAKSSLNKSIMDQGWGIFRKQLAYKLEWSGGLLVAVSPRNTSRMCSACGAVSADNRKSQASFICVACGFQQNADHNAAINILAAARRFSLQAVFV